MHQVGVHGLQTLYCGNVVGDQLVQVTGAGVRLLSASSGALLDQWTPPAGLQVNTASASPSQVPNPLLASVTTETLLSSYGSMLLSTPVYKAVFARPLGGLQLSVSL